MQCTAITEDVAVAICESEYRADVFGARDTDGQQDATVRIESSLSTDNEGDERRVTGIASKKLSENTKLGCWVTAILGRMPTVEQEITVKDLHHKHCRVVVKHKTNPDSKTFASVVQVLSANR
jgi:hypothetical protein